MGTASSCAGFPPKNRVWDFFAPPSSHREKSFPTHELAPGCSVGSYETASVHLSARYYEPVSGRFLSVDPLGFAGSTSLYDFGGDPVNHFDADGRCAEQGGDWWNPSIMGDSNFNFATGATGQSWITNWGQTADTPASNITPTNPSWLYTPPQGLVNCTAGGPPLQLASFSEDMQGLHDDHPFGYAVMVAGAAAPASLFGGEAIAAAYAASEIGPGLALTYGAIFNGGVSVMTNTASQLTLNGGDLDAVNPTEQKVALGVGGIFGATSSVATIASSQIEQSATNTINNYTATASDFEVASVLRMQYGPTGAADQSAANSALNWYANAINQTASSAAMQTSIISATDTFVSPVAQDRFEAQVQNIVQGLESTNGTPSH